MINLIYTLGDNSEFPRELRKQIGEFGFSGPDIPNNPVSKPDTSEYRFYRNSVEDSPTLEMRVIICNNYYSISIMSLPPEDRYAYNKEQLVQKEDVLKCLRQYFERILQSGF
jgi:hypothetical protein